MEDIKQIKFPLLYNEEWLREKYISQTFTTQEISELIGCSKNVVRTALLSFNIQLRTAGESISLRSKRLGFTTQYEQLQDKNWLNQKYWVENLSLNEIAQLVGAKNSNSVKQALEHAGIKLRNVSEGLTVNREDDGFVLNRDVINGSLLGDAGLRCWSKMSDNSMPCFYKRNKNYDHVIFVANQLFNKDPESVVKEELQELNGSTFTCFLLRSLTHKELVPYWNNWYPASNNFVKVVPRDIILTPKVLLHWFLDDGTTSYHKRTPDWQERKKQVRLTFCSESFSEEDQRLLCWQLNSKYSLKSKLIPCQTGTKYRIGIPQSKVSDFFDVIGGCPESVPSMAYKWKLP